MRTHPVPYRPVSPLHLSPISLTTDITIMTRPDQYRTFRNYNDLESNNALLLFKYLLNPGVIKSPFSIQPSQPRQLSSISVPAQL